MNSDNISVYLLTFAVTNATVHNAILFNYADLSKEGKLTFIIKTQTGIGKTFQKTICMHKFPFWTVKFTPISLGTTGIIIIPFK